MPLSMRPTGPPSPVDRDRKDYTVYSGGWPMGRIYEERSSPEHLRWFWSIFGVLAKPADVRTDGRAPTLEAANLPADLRKLLEWLDRVSPLLEAQIVAAGFNQTLDKALMRNFAEMNLREATVSIKARGRDALSKFPVMRPRPGLRTAALSAPIQSAGSAAA